MPASGHTSPSSRFESNPFCTRFVRPGQIPYHFADDISSSVIVDSVIESRAGLIVGPHGTGKSTLVQTLRPHLNEHFDNVTHIQFCAPQNKSWLQRRRQAKANAAKAFALMTEQPTLVIIDGIEQLSGSSRRRLIHQAKKNGQSILATSHRDLSGLQTLYRTSTSSQIVEQLTESLLAGQSLQLQSRIQQALADRSIESSTNVRDLWFEMYDLCVPEEPVCT